MLRTANGCYVPEYGGDIDIIAGLLGDHNWVAGIDVETWPDNPKRKTPDAMHDHLLGTGLSFFGAHEDPQLMVYIPQGTPDATAALNGLVGTRPWYAFNAIFDATVLRNHDVTLRGEHLGDARIIAYLLGEPEADLKTLLELWLGDATETYQEILAAHGASDLRGVPVLDVARYCAEQDAARCVPLERRMRRELQTKNPRAYDVYEKVERHIVPVLVAMTSKGIAYDRVEGQKRLDKATAARDTLDALIAPIVEATGFKQYEVRGGQVWHPTCKSCRNGKLKRVSCTLCGGAGKLDAVPKAFNPGSSEQVRAFLYEHLGLPERRFTGNVKPWMIERGYIDPETLSGSTDALALLQLAGQHPSIPLMISRRKFKKDVEFLTKWHQLSQIPSVSKPSSLTSTSDEHGNIFEPMISSHNASMPPSSPRSLHEPSPLSSSRTGSEHPVGRLHTMFTNTTVASGRLSSRDPNLQQVTRRFRDLMVADPGTEIVAGDMGQLELVISAYMSRDPVMINILRQGWDMHRITAEAIYNVPWREIPKDSSMREVSKVANYLSSYGGAKDKLLEGIEKKALSQPELGLTIPTPAECGFIIRQVKRKYAGYWRWVEWTKSRTRELGYSETAFGRPRYFPDILSGNDEYRSEAERAAVNHCIQGTAADLMKMAMLGVHRDSQMSMWGDQVLQVHDEIVSIVKTEYVVPYMERLTEHMLLGQPFEPVINLTVDVGHGPSWKETHK